MRHYRGHLAPVNGFNLSVRAGSDIVTLCGVGVCGACVCHVLVLKQWSQQTPRTLLERRRVGRAQRVPREKRAVTMNNQFSSEAEQPDLDAQLVAYLDGELDVDESRRIEEALATDPKVRNLLQQLERSWELMDRLPRAEVDENFARTTVEMIAVQAEEDLEREQKQLPRRRRRAWLVGAGGLLAVAAAGFVLVTIFSPRQNDELLMDLPIIENLEQYRQTEDIEFLRLLEKQGVFDQEAQHAP